MTRLTRCFRVVRALVFVVVIGCSFATGSANEPEQPRLQWTKLPDLPDPLGVAGPFVGVHGDVLIVAGGANFPQPVWENDKVWRDTIYVLRRTAAGYVWRKAGRLNRPVAYGAAVSAAGGVICMGGNDAEQTYDDCFLLRWDRERQAVEQLQLPKLPKPCAFGQAVLIDETVYLAGGQSGQTLDTAMRNFWTLDLGQRYNAATFKWQAPTILPGPTRSLNQTVAQFAGDSADGQRRCLYVFGGRRQQGEQVEFLRDLWEYNPATKKWRQRASTPRPVMAGLAAAFGERQIAVLGGADGALYGQADTLRDRHPGFPKSALLYDTVADRWSPGGKIPLNHVTSIPVRWGDQVIVASGEVRPRVRTRAIWSVKLTPQAE